MHHSISHCPSGKLHIFRQQPVLFVWSRTLLHITPADSGYLHVFLFDCHLEHVSAQAIHCDFIRLFIGQDVLIVEKEVRAGAALLIQH